MLVDTLGMSLLFLPDIQYHFHGLDPNLMVNHAYNTALYLLINNNPIETGDTIDGITDGSAQPERWICRYEESLIPPRCLSSYYFRADTLLLTNAIKAFFISSGIKELRHISIKTGVIDIKCPIIFSAASFAMP